MPTKPRYFDPKFCYHLYNRGIEKRTIFETEGDFQRFLGTVLFYKHAQRIRFAEYLDLDNEGRENYARLHPTGVETLRVKLITLILMPNHFHFIVKPNHSQGVSQFISDLANSYTRYFNEKNERSGNLLEGTFKSKEIRGEESLLQVTRYVHLNATESSKTNPDRSLKPEDYIYSSYGYWIGQSQRHPTGVEKLLDKEEIDIWVEVAGGPQGYREFVESKIGKKSELGIENLIIEKP